jgi:predicted SAM-dependent methyltransferase
LQAIFLYWPEFRDLARPHLRAIRKEAVLYQTYRRNVKKARKYLMVCPLRLELGSGSFRRSGWVGIDVVGDPELELDLRRPLPFPDNSVDEIHSEHFLEHLCYSEVTHVLRECWRVLKEGGMISFSVPNMRPYLQAYSVGDVAFLRERVYDTPRDGRYDRCGLDIINWFALREGDHKFMFDDENAVLRLREAGFVGVGVREFDPERDYNRRSSSVYVQGAKSFR